MQSTKRSPSSPVFAGLVAVLTSACSSGPDAAATSFGPADDPAGTSDGDPGSSTEAQTSIGGGESSGPAGTVGAEESSGGASSSSSGSAPAGPGIDVLFVLDNSPRDTLPEFDMALGHQRLIDSAPEFLEALQDRIEGSTVHAGVVTSDEYSANADSGDGCDALSGLVQRTSFGDCGPYAAGGNFMTTDDDLQTTFACAARVGVFGDARPRVAEAALRVVEGGLTEPGECNEGFVRDEALLVLVLLADGDAAPRTGPPTAWFSRLQAARDPASVYVVSIIDPVGLQCDGNDIANEDGAAFSVFTSMFGSSGVEIPLCDLDYGRHLADQLDPIVDARSTLTSG